MWIYLESEDGTVPRVPPHNLGGMMLQTQSYLAKLYVSMYSARYFNFRFLNGRRAGSVIKELKEEADRLATPAQIAQAEMMNFPKRPHRLNVAVALDLLRGFCIEHPEALIRVIPGGRH